MKKTLEQLIDENPDKPHEEVAKIYVEQPEDVASADSERIGLGVTEDPKVPKFGLGVTESRTMNRVPGLGVKAPSLVDEEIVATRLAATQAQQPQIGEDPSPQIESSAPEQEPTLTEAQQYTKNQADAKQRVSKLYGDREELETQLGKDIQVQEDDVKQTREDGRLESSLYAGGKVMSGTLGNILGYNSKPQTEGFQSALDSVDKRPDAAKQRREYLQQRLYRADDATKREAQKTAALNTARNESLAESLGDANFQNKFQGLNSDTSIGEYKGREAQEKLKDFDSSSIPETVKRNTDKKFLQQVAEKSGPNQTIAQELLAQYDGISEEASTIDGLPAGLGLMSSRERKPILDELKKAEKEKKSYSFKQFEAGANTGYGSFDENTGEFTKLDEGVKPFRPSASGQSQLENKTMQLSDRIVKNNINSIDESIQGIDRIVTKYGGKMEKVPGTSGVMRVLPNFATDIIAPEDYKELKQYIQKASNGILKSESGASVTDQEEKRQLTALGQGGFSSPEQLQRGVEIIRNINERMRKSVAGGFNKTTQEAYVQQGGVGLTPGQKVDGKTGASPRKIITDPNEL